MNRQKSFDVKKLYRFEVELFEAEADDWRYMGQVLLYDYAPYHEVEHALAALGIYMPRGDDELDWETLTSEPSAIIREFGETVTCRMRAIEP